LKLQSVVKCYDNNPDTGGNNRLSNIGAIFHSTKPIHTFMRLTGQ